MALTQAFALFLLLSVIRTPTAVAHKSQSHAVSIWRVGADARAHFPPVLAQMVLSNAC